MLKFEIGRSNTLQYMKMDEHTLYELQLD